MNPIMGFKRGRARTDLFVVLHAFCGSPDGLGAVCSAIGDAYPDADIYAPRMPYAGGVGWLCRRDATEVVRDLIETIDQIVEDRQSLEPSQYRSINFIGHSMGAVLARKLAI